MSHLGNRNFRFGSLHASVASGGLRYLGDNAGECFRAIGMVIRDREWRTPEPSHRRVRIASDGSLSITGRTPVGAAAIDWVFRCRGGADAFQVETCATAIGNVFSNRCGLVVLLAADRYAGAHCDFVHPHGRCSGTLLPHRIAPHAPARDIESMSVRCRDGLAWQMTFAGELFEMEDQRNWLDPTFKIFGRPLALPVPIHLRNGQMLRQSLSWQRRNCARTRSPARHGRIVVGAVPELGLATVPGRVPRRSAVVDALRDAEPAFVLHRVGVADDGEICQAAQLAARLFAELRLEWIGADAAEVNRLVRHVPSDARASVASLALHRAQRPAQLAASRAFRSARRVTGTFADFVELNRNDIPAPSDRVTFGVCPTVHARDDRTFIEAVDAMPAAFVTARRIAGGRPVDVGPCSIRRRLLPRNGRPAVRPLADDGSAYDVDPRQREPIAAAWLAATICQASAARMDSLCVFEAAGERGLIAVARAGAGRTGVIRTPAFAVFAAFASLQGGTLRRIGVDGRTAAAFTTLHESRELWLVELAGQRRSVETGPVEQARRLEVRSGSAEWMPVMQNKNGSMRPGLLRIGAYGIARLLFANSVSTSRIDAIGRRWLADAHIR